MFDFLAENIFALIPVAVFIALRIFAARKKAEEKFPSAHDGETGDGNIFGLFDEDDEEPRPAGEPAAAWKETVPAPKPAVKQIPATKKIPPAAARQVTAQLTETKTAPKASKSKSPAEPAQSGGAGRDFTANLARLSPLQRAVAMAEILGPPKGI